MNFARNEDRLGELPHSQKISSRARGALLLAGILAPMALLWGCFWCRERTKYPTTASPNIQHLGDDQSGNGGSGATVTLSGAAAATTTANSSGNYTFSGLANGTYTVTPSHAGYTFSPTSLSVTVSVSQYHDGIEFHSHGSKWHG